MPLICFLAALVLLPSAAAQSTYTGALSAGSAFVVDVDDPDPAGSFSLTAALERRQTGKSLSLGVEAGLHRYLAMRQNLPPDISGWASKLEDERKAWRVTPFIRWQTRGAHVRLYGQLGAGLYILQTSYFQQEHLAGQLVLDVRRASTDPRAGFNLGVGLELYPGGKAVGIGAALGSHNVISGGDGFYTAQLGVLIRLH